MSGQEKVWVKDRATGKVSEQLESTLKAWPRSYDRVPAPAKASKPKPGGASTTKPSDGAGSNVSAKAATSEGGA